MPTVRRVQILQRLNNEAGGKINRMRLKCACEHSTEGKSLPKPVYFAFLQAFAKKIIKNWKKPFPRRFGPCKFSYFFYRTLSFKYFRSLLMNLIKKTSS
jgi:hypothetical protein